MPPLCQGSDILSPPPLRTLQTCSSISSFGVYNQYATSTHQDVTVNTSSAAFVSQSSQPNQEIQHRAVISPNQIHPLTQNLTSESLSSSADKLELAKVNQSYQWATNPLPANISQSIIGGLGVSGSTDKPSQISTDQATGGQTFPSRINKTSVKDQEHLATSFSSNISLPPSNLKQQSNQNSHVQQDSVISNVQTSGAQSIQTQLAVGPSENLSSSQLKYGSQQNIFSTSSILNSSAQNLFANSQNQYIDPQNSQDYCSQPLKNQQNLLTGYMDPAGLRNIPQGQNVNQNLPIQRKYPQDTASTMMLSPKTIGSPLGVNQLHSARLPPSAMPPLPGYQMVIKSKKNKLFNLYPNTYLIHI